MRRLSQRLCGVAVRLGVPAEAVAEPGPSLGPVGCELGAPLSVRGGALEVGELQPGSATVGVVQVEVRVVRGGDADGLAEALDGLFVAE